MSESQLQQTHLFGDFVTIDTPEKLNISLQAPDNILQESRYAQVLVDCDAKSIDRRTFSYIIPSELADLVDIGIPVKVPFGHKPRTGYVVGFTQYVEPGIRLKAIIDVLDTIPLFDLDYLQFLDWAAQYYACPLMTFLDTALPPAILQKSGRKIQLVEAVSYSEKAITALDKQLIVFLKDKKNAVSPQHIAQRLKCPIQKLNQSISRLQRVGLVTSHTAQVQKLSEKTITVIEPIVNADTQKLSKRQLALLSDILKSPGLPVNIALQGLKTTRPTLQKLVQAGVIQLVEHVVHRDRQSVLGYDTQNKNILNRLNPAQKKALDTILSPTTDEANPEKNTPWLLHGVTGSGKTEVYIALTQYALTHGQSVLILLPEITLTSHIARRFIDVFGNNDIVLWHSQLSQGEKVDAWRRIQQGELRIVIGARSAIFAPMKNLGAIIIDEEHEASFKQESPNPRYSAKTMAEELARRTGAKLLLGSATPDCCSYLQAQNNNRLLQLVGRFSDRPMPQVNLIDMTQEAQQLKQFGDFQNRNISMVLFKALQTTIDNQQQAILLLNRRGFHTLIQCQSCTQIITCEHCSVNLTYHQSGNYLQCHYCGHTEEKPKYCKHCASPYLKFAGMGTQRLEIEIQQGLPNARILRLDGDIMQSKTRYREILDAFRAHEADILLGTQMIAKGLDIANVTMVGVLGADMAMHMPDYRAQERAFQLLTQVAGRAGRGEVPGTVYLQTWQPHHPLFQHVIRQDYQAFYADEIAKRQEWYFPPFSQLFRFIVSSPEDIQAKHYAKALKLNLDVVIANKMENADLSTGILPNVELLGPAACLIHKVQGKYRYHVLIKNRAGESIHQLIADFYRKLKPPDNTQCILDIDAQSVF